VVLIHELGHFLAMKYFGYKDLGMFFIPLLGAYVSGTKKKFHKENLPLFCLQVRCPALSSDCFCKYLSGISPMPYLQESRYNIFLCFLFSEHHQPVAHLPIGWWSVAQQGVLK
jgi:hypothetical protein